MALCDPRIGQNAFTYSCGEHMELNESFHNDPPDYVYRSNSYNSPNVNNHIQDDFMSEILTYKIKQMEQMFDDYCDSLDSKRQHNN
jgi:hypothetical protein